MGLLIGNTSGVLGALAGSSRVRPVTLFEPGERSRPRLPNEQDDATFPAIRSNRDETPRVGLGSGAASGPNNALTAISRTVEGVNRTRLSLEEITSRSQERAAQARARFQEQVQTRREAGESQRAERGSNPLSPSSSKTPQQVRQEVQSPFASRDSNRVESRLPEASVQARNFVSTRSDTAADVLARAGEAERTEPSGGPSIQINGQSIPFGNDGAGQFRFNITA